MDESMQVVDAYRQFCARLSAGDVAGFDDVVARDARLVIGTAPGEWVDDRNRMRFGFEAEGVALAPNRPEGYEEGTVGWLVDEPTFSFPDGSSISVRLTMVLHREDDRFKLVHGHFSVGVPDDEVVALQRRWS